MPRTLVTFEADFPIEFEENEPLNSDLVEFLSRALRAAGVRASDPEWQQYAWRLWIECERGGLSCLVADYAEPPRQWLLQTIAWIPLIDRFLRRTVTIEEHRRLCCELHRILTSDARIRSVRWYSSEEWSRPTDWERLGAEEPW